MGILSSLFGRLRDLAAAHGDWAIGLGLVSVVFFLGTLAAVPVLVGLIPEDYFARDRRPTPHPPTMAARAARLLLLLVKNLVGLLILAAGLVMLVLPGQGLLTILLGLLLMDFPGKYALERHLARQPKVRASIDWLRKRRNRPPLRFS